MKAIKIDSKNQIVYYVDLSTNNDQRRSEMYDHIDCRIYTLGYYFENGDVLFVDDEGLLTRNEDTIFFNVDNEHPLCGNGLITGPEIEFNDGTYTVEDVKSDPDNLNIKFFKLRGSL